MCFCFVCATFLFSCTVVSPLESRNVKKQTRIMGSLNLNSNGGGSCHELSVQEGKKQTWLTCVCDLLERIYRNKNKWTIWRCARSCVCGIAYSRACHSLVSRAWQEVLWPFYDITELRAEQKYRESTEETNAHPPLHVVSEVLRSSFALTRTDERPVYAVRW